MKPFLLVTMGNEIPNIPSSLHLTLLSIYFNSFTSSRDICLSSFKQVKIGAPMYSDEQFSQCYLLERQLLTVVSVQYSLKTKQLEEQIVAINFM